MILTINIVIQGRLFNGETGIIRHIEFAQSSARKVYINFSSEQAGSNAMRSSYLGSWVPIKKSEIEISIKEGSSPPSIRHPELPLTLAWASTVHKVQDLSLEKGITDFDLQKQKPFGAGQIYTSRSRVKIYDNLYCTG